MAKQYPIEIADCNSVGIRVFAGRVGATHMREVARGGEWSGRSDYRFTIFGIPLPEGGESLVVETNGDPIFIDASADLDYTMVKAAIEALGGAAWRRLLASS